MRQKSLISLWRVTDATFCVLFNAHWDEVSFRLPAEAWGKAWRKVLDTNETLPADGDVLHGGQEVPIGGRSLLLLERADGPG